MNDRRDAAVGVNLAVSIDEIKSLMPGHLDSITIGGPLCRWESP